MRPGFWNSSENQPAGPGRIEIAVLQTRRPELRIDPVEMIPAEDIHPHRESFPSESVEQIQRNGKMQIISLLVN